MVFFKMIDLDNSIEYFLTKLISDHLEIDEKTIDTNLSFDSYGLDSISAIKITDKISKHIDLDLDVSILYEYESIKLLSDYLNSIYSKKNINKNTEIIKQMINVTVSASFTAEPVEESILFFLKELGIQTEISFSPYNQIIQELINPSSILVNSKGIKVILLRVEDWFRYENKKVDLYQVTEMVEDFIDIFITTLSKDKSNYILYLAPHLENDLIRLGLENSINYIDEMIKDKLNNLKNLYITNENVETQYNLYKIFDKERDKIGHIPFTQEYFTSLGILISRKIFNLQQVPKKVIVVDCDNTLWKGVCGEDGSKVIPNIEFQNFLLKQKNEGKLLCLCSKNIENDVFNVFENNSDMVLELDDFISNRINWENKSSNIISLAKELNLGLDSFIFIDDNELECAEVKSLIKDIHIINFPVNLNDKELIEYFKHDWLFDVLKITQEDTKRTEMYQQNKLRDQLQNQFNDFEKFLTNLNIKIDIQRLDIDDFERAVQLTQKTNQFNATTVRLDENKLNSILNDYNFDVYSVKVSDRFGDYGFVGLMITEKIDNILSIHTFLLSCRVLGKRVEHQMIKFLLDENIKSKDVDSLKLNFIPTDRNKPLFNFYKNFSTFYKNKNHVTEEFKLLITFDKAKECLEESKNINFISDKDKSNDKVSNENNIKNNDLKFTYDYNLDEKIDHISKLSSNITEALNKIRLKKIPRPESCIAYIAPRTSIQKLLCNIYSDTLGIEKIGIYDSFYDLGGDSLALTELSIKLWEIGLPEDIPITSIEKPTPDLFSKIIENPQNFHLYLEDTVQSSLEHDSELSFDFDLKNHKIAIENDPKNILLTGVTGYVGAYLLFELLKNTQAQIFCHVRAKNLNEGFERVRKNLRTYDLWDSNFENRIEIINGDLAKDNLGLNDEIYNTLIEKIDTIYHNGAWVNFVFPYNMLKPANVTGTENIIKFTIDKKIKALHFISTLGVLMSGKNRNTTVFEDEELKDSEDLPNGYEQSKWVADKMVWRAIQKGLPANIYRLGMLSGLSESGIYHKLNEFLPSFLKGSIQLGSFPDISTKIEMVPVDFIVKSLVNISKNNEIFGKTYQMNHPSAMTGPEFAKWITDYGYPLRLVSWDIWKNQLLKSGEKLRNNALYPYIDFIKVLQEYQTYMPEMDMSNFLNSINNNNLDCPDQKILLKRYFDYFVEQEYLHKPQ